MSVSGRKLILFTAVAVLIGGAMGLLLNKVATSGHRIVDDRFAIGNGLAVAWQHVGDYKQLLPIGVVGLVSWSVWLFRRTLSRFYRPTPVGYRTTTSVVVPAYREDPDILERCLKSWLAEDPTEVIVVPDVEDTEVIARLAAWNDPRLHFIPFAHQGKRSALGVGIRAATSEVLVLTDSDTEWLPAGRHDLKPWTGPKHGVGELGAGRDEVLAVVENEQ